MQYAGPHRKTRDAYGVELRLDPWFVTGLAEGEGCLCVSFAIRPRLRIGLEARPSFSLSLNERDRDLLEGLQGFFSAAGSAGPAPTGPQSMRAARWVPRG